jgi:hypothetical protein
MLTRFLRENRFGIPEIDACMRMNAGDNGIASVVDSLK